MAKYSADTRYIASIYPGKLTPVGLPFGAHPSPKSGRFTIYCIDPVERGSRPGFKVIEVTDMFQNVLDVAEKGASGKAKWLSNPVDVDSIVQNLLRVWNGNMANMPQGGGLGIRQISNSVPTQQDLREMKEELTTCYEFLFQEGERLHRESDWKSITGEMRNAAAWLNRDRTWSKPSMASETKMCPACVQVIPATAAVCFHCGSQIAALPEGIARGTKLAGDTSRPAA